MSSVPITQAREAPSGDSPGREVLPSGLRLLCVGASEPSWVGLTLQLDARGSHEPKFRWVATPAEALAILAEESFDCLLLRYQPVWDPSGEDPLALARAVRAGGSADPIVVVTQLADDGAWSNAIALDVDLLVTPSGWESTALIPAIARAVSRGRIRDEIDRLRLEERRRLLRDRGEAESILAQQIQIVSDLESLTELEPACGTDPRFEGTQRTAFADYYQELLRGYVMMSSGTLSDDVRKLADVFRQADVTPRNALRLHLRCLERLINGLGSRSSRHVLTRANLLALELMLHLAESRTAPRLLD